MIQVSDIQVQVVRKDIRHLYLAVYPPDGRVRLSAPLHVTDDEVRWAIIARLAWIRKRQSAILRQTRQSRQSVVSGECHYVFGRPFLLEVVERRGRHEVLPGDNAVLSLYVNPGTTPGNRQRVLNEWYRDLLKDRIPTLLEKWQPVVGKAVAGWGVKRMKTRWGSCNIHRRRIWLNLELARKPVECLEYVLVHELVHLHERYHNDNFRRYMDTFMPQWRAYHDTLNNAPAKNRGQIPVFPNISNN
ncbi:MAG: SprT family zinc-dependent metalloprotease [Thiohalobacterales bacterium]|nr:SprT family zinc-dependent metalloprotease [Thiohalobacterales bacterium]